MSLKRFPASFVYTLGKTEAVKKWQTTKRTPATAIEAA
jgi:hypothetical protein